MANIQQATIVAARWWTEKIGNPILDNFCNGDRRNTASFMIMMMGHTKALNHVASEKQLEKFCDMLAQRISEELTKTPKVDLDCDYVPCCILDETAKESEIDACLFPYKRIMQVTADSVKVKDGYDAKWVTIYHEKKSE